MHKYAPSAPSQRIPETEKGFQAAVVALAQRCGWKVYHPYRSDKSAPGFPDLTLAKAGQPIVFAELKTQHGRLTAAQHAWFHVLEHASGCEVYCWRPTDWPCIQARLQGTHVPRGQ